LRIQLNRKPIQLYLKAINVIKLNKKQLITYKNVSQIIKDDIKIRNNIRLEYIDKTIELADLYKILYFVINELKKEIYHEVREIRNDVSHIPYLMIFGSLEDILIKLNNIKSIDFVINETFDICIKKINEIKERWLK